MGTIREDEVTIASQIRGKLSAKDAVQFDKLHNDLKDGVKIIAELLIFNDSFNIIVKNN